MNEFWSCVFDIFIKTELRIIRGFGRRLRRHGHPERNHYCVRGKKLQRSFAVKVLPAMPGALRNEAASEPLMPLTYFTAKLRPNRANGAGSNAGAGFFVSCFEKTGKKVVFSKHICVLCPSNPHFYYTCLCRHTSDADAGKHICFSSCLRRSFTPFRHIFFV